MLAFAWEIRSQFFPRILGFGVFVSGNHTPALNVKYVGKIQSLSPDYIVVSGPNQLSRAMRAKKTVRLSFGLSNSSKPT